MDSAGDNCCSESASLYIRSFVNVGVVVWMYLGHRAIALLCLKPKLSVRGQLT